MILLLNRRKPNLDLRLYLTFEQLSRIGCLHWLLLRRLKRFVSEFEVWILHRLGDSTGLFVLVFYALVSLAHLAHSITEA